MDRPSFSSTAGMRFSFPSHGTPNSLITPSPFERIHTEESAELNASRLLIDTLQQRVNILEKINLDLEGRLEKQAAETMIIEKEIMDAMRKLSAQEQQANLEKEEWASKFMVQESKSERLREHLSRTERELYGILQKKYELIRGPVNSTTNLNSSKPQVNARNKSWENMRKDEGGALSNAGAAFGTEDFLATLQVKSLTYRNKIYSILELHNK